MENKFKKVGLIILLIVIIVIIAFVVLNSSSGKKEAKVNTNSTTVERVAKSDGEQTSQTTNSSSKLVKVTTLNDGIKYSVTDEKITPEIVVGDNYYGTQLADINMNFSQYEGKTIEIEGLYFENSPYTFIGRYSTSNVCPTCPTGYSYFEYEWNGEEELPVTDSETWLKIVGTLKKGNDGVEYYYIDVANVEIMNKAGIDTVSN
jgi:flagellar basal body-associated protein FliL